MCLLCPKSFVFGMLQCLHMLNDCFRLYVLFVEGASSSLSLSFLFFMLYWVVLGMGMLYWVEVLGVVGGLGCAGGLVGRRVTVINWWGGGGVGFGSSTLAGGSGFGAVAGGRSGRP